MKLSLTLLVVVLASVLNVAAAYGQALPGMQAAIATAKAYRNYDVYMKHQRTVVADEIAEGCGITDEFRIIIDHENESILCFKSLTISDLVLKGEEAKQDKKPTPKTYFFMYRDGQYSGSESSIPTGVQAGFEDYIRMMRIPLVEYAGLSSFPYSITEPSDNENERQAKMLESFPGRQSSVLANGQRMETWYSPKGDALVTRLFDPSYVLPVELLVSNVVNGVAVEKPTLVKRNKLENANGVCRLESSTTTTNSFMQIPPNDKRIQTVQTETLTLTWHQFNVEHLEFPANEKELIADRAAMLRFIREGTDSQ